jgi:hypothetical protein
LGIVEMLEAPATIVKIFVTVSASLKEYDAY